MDDEDADDTISADPDVEDAGLSVEAVTDGDTPDENREVGLGVEGD